MMVRKSNYAYIAPTYRMAKNIAWEILKEYTKPIDGVKFNEAELRCDFMNGSRITLFGADNPDSLRGISLWGVVFDEYSQQPGNIFTEIIRPALADHEGWGLWIGTPKGRNAFKRLYDHALANADDWLAMLRTVDDTKVIPDKEIQDAKKIMDEDEFLQEWYCSWNASVRGAYYAKQIIEARASGRVGNVPYEQNLRVDTWWDLGIGDATAIWFTQSVGREVRVIDYFEATGEGFPFYAKVLQGRGYIYGTHNAPHDIEVRELGSGVSRIETARTLGITFRVVKNIPIDDGISAARTIFNQCWFDETKCRQGLDALANYHKEYDDKRQEFKDAPYHDWSSHAADSWRYCAVGMKTNTHSSLAAQGATKYTSDSF